MGQQQNLILKASNATIDPEPAPTQPQPASVCPTPRREDFFCEFCNDEFRSETSLKIHRLSCSNKKNQTETSKPSETEVNKPATINDVVASEAEENVQKEQETSAMVP